MMWHFLWKPAGKYSFKTSSYENDQTPVAVINVRNYIMLIYSLQQ
jgi:hypothetical protein